MISSLLVQGLANLFQLGACGAPIASQQFNSSLFLELGDSKLVRFLDGNFYTSSDFGFTWNEVSEIQDTEDFTWPIYAKKEDLIALGPNYEKAYITFDSGLSFTQIQLPEELIRSLNEDLGGVYTQFSVNHDHPEWLIVNNDDVRVPWLVAMTRDAGKTWQYHDPEMWESCEFIEGGQFVENLIHCQRRDMENESINSSIFDLLYDTDYYTDTYYSTDATEPFMLVEGIPHRSSVQRHGDILIAADDDSHELTISYDGIHFNKVEFPAKMSPSETDSTVFVQFSNYFDSRGSLLVFVPYLSSEKGRRGRRKAGIFGNVFTLENPFEFKLLAENVAALYGKQALITPIESEDGVFIATIVANPDSVKFSNEDPIYKTVITFDGGDNWNSLTGPDGNQLHLFMSDLEFPIYRHSRSPAPGLFSAYGNEGDCLASDSILWDFVFNTSAPSYQEVHSYLTHDAGHTWTKVNDKPVDYEIGDYGNVLVKQPKWNDDTKDLEYSTDRGYTWHKYELGFNAALTHITSERSGAGKNFIVNYESRREVPEDPDAVFFTLIAFTLSFEQEQNQDQILFLN